METIAKTEQQPEQAQEEPKENWSKPKWDLKRFVEFETPQEELEAEPEYQHFVKVCHELGLKI